VAGDTRGESLSRVAEPPNEEGSEWGGGEQLDSHTVAVLRRHFIELELAAEEAQNNVRVGAHRESPQGKRLDPCRRRTGARRVGRLLRSLGCSRLLGALR
jgi:hypothetical protein